MRLILLFMLIGVNCIAQSKIQGIGKFKIGKFTIDSLKAFDTKGDFTQSLPPDPESPKCDSVKMYAATYFEVSDIALMNLQLFFYDGLLFMIRCEYTEELKRMIVYKYGKGTPYSFREKTKCRYRTPDKKYAFREDKTNGIRWTNGDITASLRVTKQYNSDCEIEEDSKLSVSLGPIALKVFSCEMKALSKQVDELESEIKRKVDEF